MEYITLKESTGLKRFGIKTADGKDTGEYIEIDLEDMELPLKVSECESKHEKNRKILNEKMEKAEEKSNEKVGDELLTEMQRAKLEALKEYYKAEEEALDEFLGQGATRKLLGGRKPYLTMYEDIDKYLEQILPTLEETQKNLETKIKAKYKAKKEDNVL